jgi:hypothetical protein
VSIVDLVQQHLGSNEIQQISQQIGADPATTERAIQTAVPMLVAGMAGTAQQPDGATQIQSLLGTHGNVLGNLGAMLGAGAPADGGSILGSILGSHRDTVQQGVQQTSGLDAAKTKQLLMILAPIVIGALARRHSQSANADLGTVLNTEAQTAKESSPQVGGILGKILNQVQTPRAP